ncbi:hypothetical protein ACHAPN_007398 [Verticillium nonalfalfae]
MDGDWDQVARIPFPPPGVRAMATPVTTMTFDPQQELLWTGNDYGRVTSFYGTELQRYTSFKAFSTHGDLTSDRSDEFKDLRCMNFTSKGQAEILVAGFQDKMFVIDVNKGEITKEISTEYSYQIMKKSRYICAATKDGLINMIDPVNYSVVRSWKAHSALISDMDAQHDFIVTCGFSLRQSQSYMPDSFLNVFDIKRMTSMAPIPFPAGGAFVRMHPRMSTTSIVVSQTGQLHVVDLMNPHTSNVRQINVVNSLVTMFEIACSGEAVALADSASQIHLWGSPSKIRFVDFPQPTEFAGPEAPAPAIDWTTET